MSWVYRHRVNSINVWRLAILGKKMLATNKLDFGILALTASIFAFTNVAMGQEEEQAGVELEEIVVTGTLLRADGFEAPTPVTVIPINDLRNAIVSCYENKLSPFRVNIDYKHARLISQIRKHVIIVDTDYEETFIRLHLRLPPGGKEKVYKILKQTNQSIAIRQE